MFKFKNMAKEMTEDEIKVVMFILVGECVVTKFVRYEESNYIDAFFEIKGYANKIALMADSIEDVSDEIEIKDLWMYSKFMIAKGYSELLENNPFL